MKQQSVLGETRSRAKCDILFNDIQEKKPYMIDFWPENNMFLDIYLKIMMFLQSDGNH